jgi:hypothetical protein
MTRVRTACRAQGHPGRSFRRGLVATAFAGLLVGSASTGVAAVVHPAPGDRERISSYSVELVLRQDASMRVQETIVYDFGPRAVGRHGIVRDIPVWYPHDVDHRRVYPVDNVEVSSPSGAPTDLEISGGDVTHLGIGDPDREVRGEQTYVISYDVHGVVNPLPDHQELYWNPIDEQWRVPVIDASVTLEGPAKVRQARCFRGARGSVAECDRSVDDSGQVRFSAAVLDPGQGLAVVASFPSGTFPSAAPILEPVWRADRAFATTPATVGVAGALLVLLVGGVLVLAALRGRDERYLGTAPGLSPGSGGAELVSRWFLPRHPPVTLRSEPPPGLRPGMVGTLLDERANVIDVTATLLDLAVRGYLRIEETGQDPEVRIPDWWLVRLVTGDRDEPREDLDQHPPGPGATGPVDTDDELRPYEAALLEAVFRDGERVRLADVVEHLRQDLVRVQRLLYQDVTARGWMRGHPAAVRFGWYLRGGALVAVGVGATAALALWTGWGLVGLPVVLAGVVAVLFAARMPVRTTAGTAVLAQAKGFRLYLETVGAEHLPERWSERVFGPYLPYAVVFGLTRRWTGRYRETAGAAAGTSPLSWFVVPDGQPPATGSRCVAWSVEAFTAVTTGAIAAATPSSTGSSGFGSGPVQSAAGAAGSGRPNSQP